MPRLKKACFVKPRVNDYSYHYSYYKTSIFFVLPVILEVPKMAMGRIKLATHLYQSITQLPLSQHVCSYDFIQDWAETVRTNMNSRHRFWGNVCDYKTFLFKDIPVSGYTLTFSPNT
jgi:hypothetical protein